MGERPRRLVFRPDESDLHRRRQQRQHGGEPGQGPRLTYKKEDLMRYMFRGKAKRAVKGVFGSKKSVALVVAVLGASVVAAVGLAGIWVTTVSQDTNNVRMRVVQNTAGNFDSGWHYHPGLVVVHVQKGSVAFTTAISCTTKTYSAGESFVEDPYVPGRAVALGEFWWTATYIIGYGDPLAIPVTTNPCP
jgi:quercetin dioxygenase-like cupin family protein